MVHGECRAANVRLRGDYAVGKGIGGRAAVDLIPAVGELVPEAERESESRAEAHDVFGVPGAEPRAPSEGCWRWIEQKSAHRALQEGLQAGESCLAVLAQSQIFIGAQQLEPSADAQLVPPFGKGDAVVVGKQVARDIQITAVVAAGETQLRGGIGRGTAADDKSAQRKARHKPR